MSKPSRLSSALTAGRRSRRNAAARTLADWKGHLRRPQLELLEDRNLLAVAQTYFIPLPEDQIRTSLTQLYSATGNIIDSTISLLPAQNSEIIYYDQWEDGYEANIESPTQSTTQIWGDNNPANGMPPGFASDVLTASSVIVLRNNITVPRSAATIAYDGRDKVAASAAVAVNRAAWATNPGPVLSGAIEIVSTNYWGTNFVVPAGQNAPNAAFNQAFEYTSLILQAGEDGTSLAIDRDGNGTTDINVTLNQGESYQLNGGVMTGASVTSSAPIQAHVIAGDIGTQYESDWFTLYPRSSWGNTYYNPVGTTSSADPAATFLYNPNNTPITVFYDTLAGTSSVVVPAASDAATHGAVRVQMPANSGAKFYTTGAPAPAFFALGAVDTDTTGAGNNVRDWGFTLVPDNFLTPALKVGWAPGTGDQPISGNGSPVWVMAAAPTRIYVDYDGNGETGALVDPNGRRYDVHFDVSSYQSVRVFDPDKDQTGMRLYTINGVKLAGAWGEDPLASQAGNPYLDVGYTVLPLPLFYIQKSGTIIGGDGDAYADPGETIEYSIDIRNEGVLPIENIVVTDPFPANVTYVAGSTKIGDASGSPPPVSVPDDSVGTAYPLDGAGYSLTSLAVGAIKRLTFRVTVNTPLPSGTTFITNTAYATSSEGPLSATSTIPVQPATPPTCGTILFTDSGFSSAASYNENGTAYVQVSDADANANSSSVDTITVVLTNPTTADRETITLTESGANTGIFRGSIATSTSIGQSVENGTLYALLGNTIAVNYADTTCAGGGVSDTATIVAPAVTKYLYLDEDAASGDTTGELDRVDPVATSDSTTASTSILAPSSTITAAVTNSNSTTNASSLTITHNPGTGLNRLLIVSVGIGATSAQGSANSVTGVTIGSTSLTQVGFLKPSDGGVATYLFALTNPSSGSQTITITTQAASSIAAGATTFNNVDQTTPYGAFESLSANNGGSTTRTLFVPSASGELVYAVGAWDEGGNGQSITTGSGQSELWRFSDLNYVSAAASTRAGASPNVAMSYTVTDNQEFGIGGISLKPAAGTATVTFSQTPAFASNFILPAGQTLGVSAYVTVTSGSMPASPTITATLKYGSTTVATLSNPTYSSGTGLLSWTYNIPSDITIPANSTLTLDITSSQSGVGFTVDYDSSTKPSKITLPTSTYIDITSFGIYDAPYTNDGNSANDGSLITTALSGQTVYVRGLVTDPFGAADITSGSVNISPSPGTVTPTAIIPTGTLGQKIYEYAWTTGVPQGNFTVTLRADEGYEGTIYDTAGTPFTVIQQDLGTPSITEFTSGLDGPGTLTYPTNTQVCVRVTDIDQNTNALVAETVTAVIHSSSGDDEPITLNETGVNTGVFANCIPASASTVGADNNGTLYAPNLAALTVVYVDPNDSTDTSSDTASIGTPTGSAPDAKDDAVTTNEDVAVTFNVITNSPAVSGVVVDTDPNNDVLTIVGYTNPSHGTIAVSPNGSVTYTPDQDFFGVDTFTYTITDGNGGVDTATVTITINSVNDPPDANDDQFSTRHNTPLSITPTGILVNDTDIEGDTLSIVQIQGTAVVVGQTYATSQGGSVKANANGTFTYTPANGFSGADTFTYQITDGNGGFDTATVTILVDPPGTIGDLVWFDRDADGVVDADEPGIGSVQVFLDTNNNGTLDWTDSNSNLQWDAGEGERWTRTNAAGGYSFGNLPTGSYVVRVVTATLPAGMQPTYDANGGLDNVSSLTITSASLTNNSQDFGYRGTATIGDTVFFDVDGNGIQDPGEPGIPGVVVTISSDFDNDGQVESFQVTTNSSGNYSLPQLPAATWTVSVTTPTGGSPTTDFSGDSVGDAASTFVLAAGEQKLDRDFGFRGASTIGDRVWLDRNSNGTQDSGELGIVGVAIALDIDFDSNGSYDATFATTSGANGAYAFANLLAGAYRVRVTAPSGATATYDEDGVGTANVALVTLPANTSHPTTDFGYIGTGTIGDLVWFDADGDGVRDAGEPGLPGVAVNVDVDFNGDSVYDGTLSTTTNSTGAYSFAGLPAGSYRVSIPAPPAFTTQTFDLDGSLDNASLQTLAAGQSALGHDFGYTGSGTIGNYVWFDQDGDGVQDAAEPGIANVSVTVTTDLNGDHIPDYTATAQTNANGAYSFSNLIPGDYVISILAATVPANMANHPTFDADGIATPNQSTVTLSGPGALSNSNQDFGYFDTGVIGDTVFFDFDGNGVQGSNEPGWPNVTVTLSGDFDNDSIVESFTTTTDATGHYSFNNLPAGSWTVTVTAPNNATPTTDFNADSTADLATTFTLLDGQVKNDRDFGLRGASSLGDRVWFDANGNGSQDGGEPGLPGVAVELQVSLDGDSVFETTIPTTTNSLGAYSFANLPAGFYRVSIPTQPAGSTQTFDLDGTLDNASTASLTSNQTNSTLDFGYRGNGTIGDFVWFDQDGDSFQDSFEPGIANVQLTLTLDLNGDGTPDYTKSATTNASGAYQFTNLLHGTYEVTVNTATLPAGMSSFPTYDLDGIGSGSIHKTIVTLSASPNDSSSLVDFGYRGNGVLGDTVFFDYDLDGVQDPGEPGMLGVTVNLSGDFDGDLLAETFTTTTDSNGKYQFVNLPATTWTLTVIAPTGTSPTTDLDGNSTLDLTNTVTLGISQNRLDRDFGLKGNSSVGDRVWFDADADGVQDAGEPGLPGVPVRLSVDLDSDGVYEAAFDTTTNSLGLYQFSNLPAGKYRVTVITPPAFTNPTFDFDGGFDNRSQLTLSAGETASGHDFGYVGTGTIGDYVWYDRNADGVQDSIEPELSDVDVKLELDVNGDSSPDYTVTATTDANGNYSFGNLIPGTYVITVITATLPAGMSSHPTFDADGTATPNVSTVTLSGPGSLSNSNQDFGYRGAGTLGDTVFLDINGNGVQDGAEAGIPAVTVTISIDIDGDGSTESFEAITDASGHYSFDNLPPGTWTISVTPPTGTVPTTDFSGDLVGDSSATYTLADGVTDLSFDFGFQGNASIGDRVWWDADADGNQDASELGIPGVFVELDIDTNSDGTYESTISTTTGVNGVYLFDNLADGKYRVRVTSPAGTTPTFDEDGVGTANTTLVTVTTGVSHLTADFGYQGTGSIGNLVWFDADGDGAIDAGEPGLPNVSLSLAVDFNADGVFDGTITTSTNSTGQYGFANLPAGNYVVTTTPLPFSVQTYDLDGTLDDSSSETLSAGESAQNHDFGYRGTGTIGDLVWFDQDNDGFIDGFEPGLANVSVTMSIDFNGDSTPDYTASSTTDANGGYSFTHLLPGAYPILITTATLPAGMATQPTFDSDGTATPNSSTVTLAGPNSLTNLLQDFGYRGTGEIGDTVFFDFDGDGVQDADEPGMSGVVVTAASDIDNDGNLESFTTTTDSAGNYSFQNLPPGTWTITVTAPVNTTPSTDLNGDNTPDLTNTFTLADGELKDDQDFGLRGSSSIGDRVWFDANANGVQDAGEPGLPNVPLQLSADIDGDGVYESTFTTTTNSSGTYSFTHLLAGDYIVDVLTPPSESTPTFDLDGGLDDRAARSLGSNTTATDVDFGYAGIGAIGNTVWFDRNANGTQDSEPGLANVQVTLSIDVNGDSVNDYTTTAVTDATGVYSFANLIPGTYVVTVNSATLPAGMSTHPTFDADGTGTANRSTVVLSTANGMTNNAQDFGYRGGGTIGDTVFFDYDLDGVQDAGEPGIAGVVVTLSADLDGNSTIESFQTTTDNSGHYSFINLPAVTWTVSIAAPSGTFPTTDLNGDLTADLSHTFALGLDQQRLDQDFGLRGSGSIGDLVWFDANGNLTHDPTEAGLPNVTVTLDVDINGDGIIEATFTKLTNSTGSYLFSNLPAGEYTVSVSPPSFTVQTFDANGPLDNKSTVTLSAGQAALNEDFGYRGNGSIGNLLWFDVNGNGSRDANEPGIANVQVTIGLDVNGDTVPDYTAQTTTDSAGAYAFSNLIPGTYVVTVSTGSLPSGMAGNQTFDADGLGTPNKSTVALAGPSNLTNDLQDFGYRGASSVGDTVFFDYDGDGVQDANEPGMVGVTVTLSSDFDADGDVDSFTALTDSNGKYAFSNLPAANWTVTITAPSGTTPTTDYSGDSVGDLSSTFALGAAESKLDRDFGLRGNGTIGDLVWFDANANATRDAGEPGLPSVTIRLDVDLTSDGTYETFFTTTTNSLGAYTFANLPVGSYRISVPTQPAFSVQTYDLNGALDNASTETLTVGESATGHDFGYRGTGSIGDRVWFDANNNATQDAGEPGISNVQVTLSTDINGDSVPDYTTSVTTDAAGNYSFANLLPGVYTITINSATLPNGMAAQPTFDPDGVGTAHTSTVTLSGPNALNNAAQDFGYRGTGSIGNTIFFDLDADGVQDPNEPGIPGVTVTLSADFDGDGLKESLTTTTGLNGSYVFTNLPPATWVVSVGPPSGTTPTTDYTGDGTGDASNNVALALGQTRVDQNFGFVGTGQIGDRIWIDANANGVQDVGETPLNGITVNLDLDFNTDGVYDATLTTLTSGNGDFLFGTLPAGNYRVRVTPPAGMTPTYDSDGTATPNQATLSLGPNATNYLQDFGYVGAGSLAWEKRAEVTGTPLLAGATFVISPNPRTGTGSLTVVDGSIDDADSDAGQFLVQRVIPGSYVITETVAPSGYRLDDDPTRAVTVTAADLAQIVGTQGVVDLGNTDESDFINPRLGVIVVSQDKSPATPQYVRILDRATGVELSKFIPYESNYSGGIRIAVGDLTGDGIDEIVTAPGRSRNPEIRVFTQAGVELTAFRTMAYPTTNQGGVQLALGDVNGDGKLDIVTVPTSGNADVRVWYNQSPAADPIPNVPSKTFTAFIGAGGGTVTVADMGRMNGTKFINSLDGKAEIVVASGPGAMSSIKVYSNVATTPVVAATFAPFGATSAYMNGMTLSTARIDSDLYPDILVSSENGNNSDVRIWKWNGSGTAAALSQLGALQPFGNTTSKTAPVRTIAIDTTGDGIAETLVSTQGPGGTANQIRQFTITSTAPFTVTQTAPVATIAGPFFIAELKNPSAPAPAPKSGAGELSGFVPTYDALDVDRDGLITPRDVLTIVNALNVGTPPAAPAVADVDGDGEISPRDALYVVNYLNNQSAGGEGEAVNQAFAQSVDNLLANEEFLVADLADEIARRRRSARARQL